MTQRGKLKRHDFLLGNATCLLAPLKKKEPTSTRRGGVYENSVRPEEKKTVGLRGDGRKLFTSFVGGGASWRRRRGLEGHATWLRKGVSDPRILGRKSNPGKLPGGQEKNSASLVTMRSGH